MKKYIIFGTGNVAEKKYEDLMAQNAKIEYFIDSMHEKQEFHGIKVIHPTELTNLNVNEFTYVLGTLTSKISMQNELHKYGVDDSNIIIEKDYGSNSFESNVKTVNSLLIYPKVDNIDTISELERNFNLYVPNITELAKKPDLQCENGLIKNTIMSNFNFIDKISDVTNYDLVLVWNKDALNNEELKACKNVYCIDPRYFFMIDVRILIRLNYVLLENDMKEKIEQISEDNFKKLVMKAEGKDIYIYGTGPSCGQYVEKTKDSTGLKVACNLFVNSDEFMNKIKPDLYVIADEGILTDEYEEYNQKMVKYLVNNKKYLALPDILAGVLVKRFPEAIAHVISFSMDATQISFPTSKKRKLYRKAYNVITSLAVPIASSISNTIYIGGCDGQKTFKGLWEYNKELTVKDINVFYESEEKWREEYYYKHINYFEELLSYGEQKGKSYYNLCKSYIPALSKRFK